MNSKKAKALRKELRKQLNLSKEDFKKRKYRKFNVQEKIGFVDGKPAYVKRPHIQEAVNMERKFYQEAKKMVKDPNYEPTIRELPSDRDEERLRNKIISEMKEETNGRNSERSTAGEEEIQSITERELQDEVEQLRDQEE